MRRQYPFSLIRRGFHSSQPLRRLVLLSACIVMLAGGLAAFSQEATPPAPPADETALGPGQSTIRAVRISDVEGQVQVFEHGEIAFEQALPNMPAVEGMRFVAGYNGRLEIEFEDGSVARVTPESSIRLEQLRRNADGGTVTVIDALTGLTYYELNNHGNQYTVRFGADTAKPVEDAVFRVALDSAPYQLAVMHGSAHVDNGRGLSVDVGTNQTYQTDPKQPGEFTMAQSISADSWDQWNSWRDEKLSALEANQTMARAGSGDPNNPAWNDLDYYGNWYDVPGYGEVWSPAGVGSNWDPFGNGAWGYYSGVGYSWISGYPWGWLPYHCGAWDFMDPMGWIWVPGNCGYGMYGSGMYGSGWYPYATVWNVPRGYVPPPRPRGAPIRRVGTGPVGPQPVPPSPRLVRVNRGEQYSKPFELAGGARPEPRPVQVDGKEIRPMEPGIHPLQRGPVGESFTSALVRTHPEINPAALRPGAAAGVRSTAMPVQGFRTFGAPTSFGSAAVGRGGYAPSMTSHAGFGGASGGGFHGGASSGGASFSSAGGGHVGGAAPAASGGGAHH